MRRIEHTHQFKRDYKRELRGRHRKVVQAELPLLVTALASDAPLSESFRDHALSGDWRDFRDCHLRPDLILIYRKSGDDVLQLVRCGSHSTLGF